MSLFTASLLSKLGRDRQKFAVLEKAVDVYTTEFERFITFIRYYSFLTTQLFNFLMFVIGDSQFSSPLLHNCMSVHMGYFPIDDDRWKVEEPEPLCFRDNSSSYALYYC